MPAERPPKGRKKPYGSRLYTCAEDLCDPYESTSAGVGEASHAAPKPRAHAVRLVDELGDGAPASPRRASVAKKSSKPTPPAPSRRVTASRPSTTEVTRQATHDVPHEVPHDEEYGASPDSPLGMTTDVLSDAPCDAPCDAPYAILSIRPSGEGETVMLLLSLPADMHPENDPNASETPSAHTDPRRSGRASSRRLKLHLLVEQYADMHPREGSISREDAEALLDAGRFCAAVMRGMRLLSYGDRSAHRLAYQLTCKGIGREDAERAAAYLMEKGYIHEDDTARLRAEGEVRKLRGPRRIREDLRANGFTPDAVTEAMNALSEVDFEENCVTLIRKKYRVIPDDRAARQKLIAALMRQGYDFDIIRAAMRRIERES